MRVRDGFFVDVQSICDEDKVNAGRLSYSCLVDLVVEIDIGIRRQAFMLMPGPCGIMPKLMREGLL